MTVVFYISGHGFGHASRDIEIINALGALPLASRIVIRTAAPQWLFELTLKVPAAVHQVDTDTGVVQRDSLSHDIPETLRRAAAFYRDFETLVGREAAFLEESGASAVVGDIPPLAFAAAARANVPSYAVGNFTWDWIYEEYVQSGDDVDFIEKIRDAYSQAREAWRLPLNGGFESFEIVRDIPFVARHAEHTAEETRRALGLPLDRPIVLSSFGGYGLASLPLEGLDCLDRYDVVIAEASLGRTPHAMPRGIHAILEEAIYSQGLRYEDLVSAADVVLTKPGFGIIAECLANDTALVYTSRDAFREYDVLVHEMPSILRSAFIDHDHLFSGRWRAALDEAISAPEPATRPATNGAAVVAGLIASRIG